MERERKKNERRDVQEMTRSRAQSATIILTNETIIPWDCAERGERGPSTPHTHPFPVAIGPELGTETMSRNFGSNFKGSVTRLELKSGKVKMREKRKLRIDWSKFKEINEMRHEASQNLSSKALELLSKAKVVQKNSIRSVKFINQTNNKISTYSKYLHFRF